MPGVPARARWGDLLLESRRVFYRLSCRAMGSPRKHYRSTCNFSTERSNVQHLKLSADIIASRLGDYVKEFRNNSENPMSIETFSVYRNSTYMLHSDCLYLCANGIVPPKNHVLPNTNIIFCNCEVNPDDYQDCNCGIIVVDGVDEFALINTIAALFRLYEELSLEIETVPENDDALGKLIKIGERLFGCPVCLLDVYQDILASSTRGYDFLNPLWDSIAKDIKPYRCEIIHLYSDRFIDMSSASGKGQKFGVTTIDGYATATHNIYNKGDIVASFWAFKTRVGEQFTNAELQLFDWFSSKLDSWLARLGIVTEGTGTMRERYLKDLIAGDFLDELYAQEAASSVGSTICSKSEYQMFVLRPKLTNQVSGNIEANRRIVAEFPDALVCVKGSTSIALFPAEGSEYPASTTLKFLDSLCTDMHFYGILGTPFKSLLDAPRVYRQLCDCYSFIDTDAEEAKLYHFCEYTVQQTMQLIVDQEPVETIIHPQIRKLLAYDRQYHTDYLETLKVYLNNRASITSASKQLHMHRNTLQNRINRISEIVGSDFSNWETRRLLLYSIDFIHFVEKGQI